MRSFFGLALLGLVLTSCTPKIHPAFTHNRYVKDFNTYVINDSLQVSHKAYGDITYFQESMALKARLKGTKVTNVLAYGISNLPPVYEYYLLLNPKLGPLKNAEYDLRKDTLIGKDRYVFLGADKEDAIPESDFQFISNSLRAGLDYQANPSSLNDLLEEHRNSNRYLQAWKAIMTYRPTDRNEEGSQLQFALTYLSMLGESKAYKDALEKWEGNYQLNTTIRSTINREGISGYEKVKNAILELSASEQLLMFNENHFYPEHRILLDSLLPDLKAQGYTYLALEGLYNDTLLNQGKVPDLNTGFYTREPHFHRLIKKARQLGFTFVAYDFWEPKQGREAGQAQNLYEKTFGQDPEAKVVLLGGISHITEKPDSKDKVWMAQLFNETYSINPLTFSQTLLTRYRSAIDSELTLISSDQLNPNYLKAVDYHILNNLPWEKSDGNFELKNEGDTPLQYCLFEIEEAKTDYLKAVPDYAFLLEPGESKRLAVDPDDFSHIIFDENGQQTTINEQRATNN